MSSDLRPLEPEMEERLNVLVVGVGGIGRHHLFGLENIPDSPEIFALDVSQAPLEQGRIELSQRLGREPKFKELCGWSTLPSRIDLAILSTTAVHRLQAVEHLLKKSTPRAILLEKPISGSIDHLTQMERVLDGVPNVWVNYPRRISELHSRAAHSVEPGKTFESKVSIRNQGLVTNAFHIIDWFDFAFRSPIESVTAIPDSKGWFPSKRPGFVELSGEINVTYSSGSTLRIVSEHHNGPENTVFSVRQSHTTLGIDELSSSLHYNETRLRIPGLQFQSVLTTSLASSILDGEDHRLTPFTEAAATEGPLLLALQEAWGTTNRNELRIT